MSQARAQLVFGRATMCFVVVAIGIGVSSCISRPQAKRVASEPVSHVVTADIAAGIEKHIDDTTRLNGGRFPLTVKGKLLRLQLVKIHTEYLATLGPRRHFACVDMVDGRGDVYDVDFFLHGDPGAMTVTQTIPHKLNGQPFYFWKQKADKTWERVPVTEASQELMGVIVPRDEFDFRYRVTLPDIASPARLWLPLAASNEYQDVAVRGIDEPAAHRTLTDRAYGNSVLFWELGPQHSGQYIDLRYRVTRIEKAAYAANGEDPQRYLAPENLVPMVPQFKAIARECTRDKQGDLRRARALYDHVIDTLRYAKAGEGWGCGDAVFACNARHGNCTDYHAYFVGLARAVGIPARFAIGAAIPSARDEGGVDGYHCWVEFHAEGKWWPVDISEADKYSALATYYFGHHPANRFEFSRGRDLVVEPGPASGPINFLAYPVLEIAGKPARADVDFSFKRIKNLAMEQASYTTGGRCERK